MSTDIHVTFFSMAINFSALKPNSNINSACLFLRSTQNSEKFIIEKDALRKGKKHHAPQIGTNIVLDNQKMT